MRYSSRLKNGGYISHGNMNLLCWFTSFNRPRYMTDDTLLHNLANCGKQTSQIEITKTDTRCKSMAALSHVMWHFTLTLSKLKTAVHKCFWLLPLYLLPTLWDQYLESKRDTSQTHKKNYIWRYILEGRGGGRARNTANCLPTIINSLNLGYELCFRISSTWKKALRKIIRCERDEVSGGMEDITRRNLDAPTIVSKVKTKNLWRTEHVVEGKTNCAQRNFLEKRSLEKKD
jgi:hypothetical protein